MSAPVCRYFLKNNCRFGDRCRFSHDAPHQQTSQYPQNNPYVYIRENDEPSRQYSRRTTSSRDIDQIIDKIAEEAKQVERENMWPLTCVSVLIGDQTVPGWDDYSMEEIRQVAYYCKAAGRYEDYIRYFEALKQKARNNHEIFLRPGKKAEEIVREMLENKNGNDRKPSNASFNTNFHSNPTQTPYAASSSYNSSVSPFGSSGSVFGTSTPAYPSSGPNIFGTSQKSPAPGIFAMAAKSFVPASQQGSQLDDTVMETTIDNLANSAPPGVSSFFSQNMFGQVAQPTAAPSFGSQQAQSQSIFGSPVGTGPGSLVFGTGQQNPVTVTVANISAIFTPISELSQMEIEQFKATTFTLEKLPLVPPPREFCG